MAGNETNDSPRTLVGGAECAMREKYWKELSIEEKIERLRSVFKELSHQ
jgi:hypothetical protein